MFQNRFVALSKGVGRRKLSNNKEELTTIQVDLNIIRELEEHIYQFLGTHEMSVMEINIALNAVSYRAEILTRLSEGFLDDDRLIN